MLVQFIFSRTSIGASCLFPGVETVIEKRCMPPQLHLTIAWYQWYIATPPIICLWYSRR